MLYEGMRKATVYGRRNWAVAPAAGGPKHEFSSWEELIMGGTAGGRSTSSLFIGLLLTYSCSILRIGIGTIVVK